MTGIVPEHFQLHFNSILPTDIQEEAWKKFINLGIRPRSERWKYFDVMQVLNQPFQLYLQSSCSLSNEHLNRLKRFKESDVLLVFLNGLFQPKHSRLHELKLDRGDTHPFFSFDLEWYGLLNHCFSTECFRLNIDSKVSSRTIRLIHLHDVSYPCFAYTQFMVHVEPSANGVLIETFEGSETSKMWMNSLRKIQLSAQSSLLHAAIETTAQNRFIHTHVHQDAHSFYQHVNQIERSRLVRDDIHVELSGDHAACDALGLIDLREQEQCVDAHVDVVHAASHSSSNMFYKGILDHHTKSIFNGALHVQKNVNHITAYQGNHHILLSKAAEAYSKPELQIYSDQVMCKHGATVGQLDQEALFYLRSRGLHEQEAVDILLSSFKEDVKNRISNALAKVMYD